MELYSLIISIYHEIIFINYFNISWNYIHLWKKNKFFCYSRYNHKSDVWAVGCVLFELLTLHRVFDASVSRVLLNHSC